MRSAEDQERQKREDAVLAALTYGTLSEQRSALAGADAALLTRAVIARALSMRPAVRDLLLDFANPAAATLGRIAGVLARQYATAGEAPPTDLVLRFSDRYPAFASLIREQLLAVLPEAATHGHGAVRRTVEAALLSPALDESDLCGLVEYLGVEDAEILALAATHPAAGKRLWTRLLDLSPHPNVASAVAAMPAARALPSLRSRLAAGPPEALVELALDAPRGEFGRLLRGLAEMRPDLALIVLDRAQPPQSEWVATEALARMLEADDAAVRQATIAALGRLRIPDPHPAG